MNFIFLPNFGSFLFSQILLILSHFGGADVFLAENNITLSQRNIIGTQ